MLLPQQSKKVRQGEMDCLNFVGHHNEKADSLSNICKVPAGLSYAYALTDTEMIIN